MKHQRAEEDGVKNSPASSNEPESNVCLHVIVLQTILVIKHSRIEHQKAEEDGKKNLIAFFKRPESNVDPHPNQHQE